MPNSDRARLLPPAIQEAYAGAMHFTVDDLRPPVTALDEIDRTLVEHLLVDGKMSNRELALNAGISESAVSIRLRKLATSGALIFTAMIDWEVAGYEWFVVVRIKTRARSPRDVAVDVSALEQCTAVAVAVGSHEVVAYFLVCDRAELHRLTNDYLPSITGIAGMSIDLATDTSVNPRGRRPFLARDAPPIRIPAPTVDLDDLDIAILQALIDDGRQSSRKIARTHDVSEGTVRARANRLSQTGLVRVVALAAPAALGYTGVIACVSLLVDRAQLGSIRKELNSMADIVLVAVCVGSSDLHVMLAAADPQTLIELVSTGLQRIDGVLTTETLYMVDVVRFSPYFTRLTVDD